MIICGYELPTNLQNFTQKDLTEVKIFLKVLGGGYFFSNTRYAMCTEAVITLSIRYIQWLYVYWSMFTKPR